MYVLLCLSQTFYEITSDVTLPTKAQHAHSCSKLSSFEEEHSGTCQGITEILSTGVLENMYNTDKYVSYALVMEKSNSAFVNRKCTCNVAASGSIVVLPFINKGIDQLC